MTTQRTRAVSPVVAVILMVAVTVILSAVIGTFVLNLGDSVSDSASSPNVGVTTTAANGNVTVQVVTGTANELRVLVNGSVQANLTQPEPGNSVSVSATPQSDITVVTVSDGEATVISNENPLTTDSTQVSSPYTIPGPTDGLIAHWTLNSSATDSVGPYDLTEYGGPNQTASPRDGGYELDGVDDHLTNDTWTTPYPSNFTATAWVKFDSVGDGDTDRVFAADDSNSGWWLSEGDPGGKQLRFGIRTSSGSWQGVDSSAFLKNGTWYLLTVTYNASSGQMVLYANGTVVGTSSTTSPASYSGGFHIGYDEGEGNYFDGTIDDARIYNQPLNKSEVQQLYNATK